MIQKVLLVALVLIASHAIHLNQVHEAAAPVLKAGTATFKADNGDFMRACQGCGGQKPYSAAILPENKGKEQKWVIKPVGDKVTIQGFNNAYLALCKDCFDGGYRESATVHGSDSQPESLWTPEKQANGKYAFKGKNGRYLGRCSQCANNGKYNDYAYVHVNSSGAKEAQWTVTYV